jgi:hypothetical protein
VRPQCAAIAQFDIHAGVVLRETRHLNAAMDWHFQFVNPARKDPLDVVLPQPETVGVAGGEIADIQPHTSEPGHLRLLPLPEEPIGNAALIENLEGT